MSLVFRPSLPDDPLSAAVALQRTAAESTAVEPDAAESTGAEPGAGALPGAGAPTRAAPATHPGAQLDTFAVGLATLSWGDPAAPRAALLLHGLTSAAGVWWRVASGLAAEGWFVVAADLRGHGASPRTNSYPAAGLVADALQLRRGAFSGALDAAGIAPAGAGAGAGTDTGGAWDLVVGHSLGGAVTLGAVARDAGWARSALLVDPALTRSAGPGGDAFLQETLADIASPSAAAYLAENPKWHPEDAHQKVLAARQVSAYAVQRLLADTDPWDFEPLAAAVQIPVSVLGADPATGDAAVGTEQGERLARHPLVTFAQVVGAGHSIHRDDPERVIAEAVRVAGNAAS